MKKDNTGEHRHAAPALQLIPIVIRLQAKAIMGYHQEALPLHFPQFIRQGAAVNAQVIRQLLAVKRDRKGVAAAMRRLK